MSLELKNIKKLIMIQIKHKIITLLIFSIISGIFSVFSVINYLKDLKKYDVQFITNLSDSTLIVSLLFIPFLCLLTTNILSNKEISMYPGTIKTRFTSRIITDHIYIIASYFVIFTINMIPNLILVFARLYGFPLNLSMLFDIKYFLIGFIIYVSLGFMIYMAFTILNMLLSRIHYLVTIGISMTIFMLFKYEVFNFEEFHYAITSFFLKPNIEVATLVFRALLVWIILLVLAYLLTFTVRKWQMPLPQSKVFTIYFIECILFMIISVSAEFVMFDNGVSYEEFLESENPNNEKSFYMDIPENFSPADFNYHSNFSASKYQTYSVNTFAVDYEKALNNKLITDDVEIPEGQMYVNIYTPTISINGKELGNNIVNSIDIDFTNNTIVYPNKDELYVINHFLGNLCLFEKNYSPGSDYANHDGGDFYISIMIIYNE